MEDHPFYIYAYTYTHSTTRLSSFFFLSYQKELSDHYIYTSQPSKQPQKSPRTYKIYI
jgi:hypothetical protein